MKIIYHNKSCAEGNHCFSKIKYFYYSNARYLLHKAYVLFVFLAWFIPALLLGCSGTNMNANQESWQAVAYRQQDIYAKMLSDIIAQHQVKDIGIPIQRRTEEVCDENGNCSDQTVLETPDTAAAGLAMVAVELARGVTEERRIKAIADMLNGIRIPMQPKSQPAEVIDAIGQAIPGWLGPVTGAWVASKAIREVAGSAVTTTNSTDLYRSVDISKDITSINE